ncbi:hypothetical protein C5167_018733 [Papaver somniferum]|uniref:Cyanobacterial aminoacyl-tRNA synthetase CAAD domain-containing protein n=1 Tax=Papaver somniferum TaxID=3469 RepID=A0A4Y7IRG0_PAPSO|nr:protein CURVATURE THYLAKOID 1C, chloroplastic-like [Papaver somniferum]RZC50311.1 hypothetical protein C5167_018733 [Papaver somniferum]
MASITSITTPTPSLILQGRKTLFSSLQQGQVSATGGKRGSIAFVVKATRESSDSSPSIVEFVQNSWSNSEDRIAIVGLGFAGVVGFWASANVVSAVDKIPVLPSTLEFIGILFTWWFTYRYLLFKPDREELSQIVKKSISEVLGQ